MPQTSPMPWMIMATMIIITTLATMSIKGKYYKMPQNKNFYKPMKSMKW